MKKELLKKGEFYIITRGPYTDSCIIFDKFDSRMNRFIFHRVIESFPKPKTLHLLLSEISDVKKYKRSSDKGKTIKNNVPLFGVPANSEWCIKDGYYAYQGQIQVYISKTQETSKYFNQ